MEDEIVWTNGDVVSIYTGKAKENVIIIIFIVSARDSVLVTIFTHFFDNLNGGINFFSVMELSLSYRHHHSHIIRKISVATVWCSCKCDHPQVRNATTRPHKYHYAL